MALRSVVFLGRSRSDLRAFPKSVRTTVGVALYVAQAGGEPPEAKPLKGFGGRKVLEIVASYDGDTYRTVYTVKLAGTLYVLHAFQKKSKRGRETPKHDLELIRQRLREAEALHEALKKKETSQ